MSTCRQHVTARLTQARGLMLGVAMDRCDAMVRAADLMHGTRRQARAPRQMQTLPRVIAGWTHRVGWCILRHLKTHRSVTRPGVRWRVKSPAATPRCSSQVCDPGSNSRKAVSACVSSGVIPCPVPCKALCSPAQKISPLVLTIASISGTNCRSIRVRPHGCRVPPLASQSKSGWLDS